MEPEGYACHNCTFTTDDAAESWRHKCSTPGHITFAVYAPAASDASH